MSKRSGARRFYRVPVRVHWADTDAAGVVWFGNFLRFFEAAEAELFLALGRNRVELMRELGILMPRVEASCVFRAPARAEQLLEVGVAIERIAARRVTYRFEARDHATGRLLATGTYRVACVRDDSFTPVDLPTGLTDLFDGVDDLLRAQADPARP